MMKGPAMEPLLEFVPECITTPRLIVRSERAGDAASVNAAVIESMDALRPYMPWAQAEPTLAQSEGEFRRMQARVLLREDLPMLMFERDADGKEAGFIGGRQCERNAALPVEAGRDGRIYRRCGALMPEPLILGGAGASSGDRLTVQRR